MDLKPRIFQRQLDVTKKKIQKVEEMADVFLNFGPHAFLTLVPPSGYALNLKALIKVSKVSLRSQLSYEILRSSFERKFGKTKHLPGHSGLRGLKIRHSQSLI